jgi:hypothetical protein
MKRILVAYDGADSARKALGVAVELAKALGADIASSVSSRAMSAGRRPIRATTIRSTLSSSTRRKESNVACAEDVARLSSEPVEEGFD